MAQHICPFFTTVFSTGYNCTLKDIEGLVGQVNKEALQLAVPQSFVKNPKELIVPKVSNVNLQSLKFCVIASQVGGRMTLKEFLTIKVVSEQESLEKWFEIMFQVAFGLYVLQLAGVAHNDLHSGNVLVEKLDAPVTYCLCIGIDSPVYYTFQTQYTVQVYDFDRSSFTAYQNMMVNERAINLYSARIRVVETQDLFRLVFGLLYSLFLNSNILPYVLKILDIVYKEDDIKNKTIELVQNTSFLSLNGEELPAEFFTKLQPMRSVLDELAEKGQVQKASIRPKSVPNEQFFMVDSSFFQNGVVKVATVYNAIEQKQLETRPIESVDTVTAEQLRNIEVELTQDEYDMNQLLYRSIK
jgi:hypothetical protein